MKPKHKLDHMQILRYALDGASTERGLYDESSMRGFAAHLRLLDADIQEIKRRIKLAEAARQRKEKA